MPLPKRDWGKKPTPYGRRGGMPKNQVAGYGDLFPPCPHGARGNLGRWISTWLNSSPGRAASGNTSAGLKKSPTPCVSTAMIQLPSMLFSVKIGGGEQERSWKQKSRSTSHLIPLPLRCWSRWTAVANLVHQIMSIREEEKRERQEVNTLSNSWSS